MEQALSPMRKQLAALVTLVSVLHQWGDLAELVGTAAHRVHCWVSLTIFSSSTFVAPSGSMESWPVEMKLPDEYKRDCSVFYGTSM